THTIDHDGAIEVVDVKLLRPRFARLPDLVAAQRNQVRAWSLDRDRSLPATPAARLHVEPGDRASR
ncbi:MAG: hypothetical protein ACRDLK_07490, partial [Gaiellaceae bacterium]